MKHLLVGILITLGVSVSLAQSDVRREIWQLSTDIKELVQYGNLSHSQLLSVRDGLQETLASASGSGASRFMCIKGSNGRFYPAKTTDGSIVGSGSYDAGYVSVEECKNSLPGRSTTIGCAKQSNGRIYPFDFTTGTVVGSGSYDAGHASDGECKATLALSDNHLACYKQSNGRYYPSNPKTGAVIGSGSYDAGHSSLNSCRTSISQ